MKYSNVPAKAKRHDSMPHADGGSAVHNSVHAASTHTDSDAVLKSDVVYKMHRRSLGARTSFHSRP